LPKEETEKGDREVSSHFRLEQPPTESPQEKKKRPKSSECLNKASIFRNCEMEEENKHSPKDEKETEQEPLKANAEEKAKSEAAPAPKSGWGGWGFSPLSVLSDLQKAAEEISRSVRLLLLTFPPFFLFLFFK
jgi:hypothetical protein